MGLATRLYIKGLAPDVREEELTARFAQFGKVGGVELIYEQ